MTFNNIYQSLQKQKREMQNAATEKINKDVMKAITQRYSETSISFFRILWYNLLMYNFIRNF